MTKTRQTDVAIIGGGPAGLAAAIAARKAGAKHVTILERSHELGGILQQCIHNGFGLHRFQEELTGPEYAYRFIPEVQKDPGIELYLNTMVLDLSSQQEITAIHPDFGLVKLQARATVLAMGCRERTRGALSIPGTRPAGVFTAGTAQRFVNIDGYMPGKKVVILGSGDIGLIMARRFTLEGAKVEAVVEIMPYPAGLARNIAQCLEDFDIPLYLSSTVTTIHGKDRVEGVTISQVDDKWQPIPGTGRYISCDTLLLSVGLIPENELSQAANVPLDAKTGGAIVDENRETLIPGIFACGNVLHVHDLVDYVSEEAEIAGEAAARYALSKADADAKANERDKGRKALQVVIKPGENVRYVLPQRLTPGAEADLFLRVTQPMEAITLYLDGVMLARKRQVRPSEMLKIRLRPNHWENLRQNRGDLDGKEISLTAALQPTQPTRLEPETVRGARP
jgi:NADPH-dependent 2,4-dienoyl-CoA reductase/sulfur reductase-like enzyme